MWFDSHCHLNLSGFEASPEAIWANARAGGIGRVFVPGTDPSEWAESTLFTLPGVSTGVGLHPFTLERWATSGTLDIDTALSRLEQAALDPRHVAIGECGWDKPLARRCPALSLEVQTAVVERHLRLAVDMNLPVVLHVVQAHGLALATLGKYRLPRGGIIHCFSGNAELVPLYCRMGLRLGFGTQLLKPNIDKAVRALRVTPHDQLLLETDAPMSPALRDRVPNSPLALVNVAHTVSLELRMSLTTLAARTFANATQVFADVHSPRTSV